MFDSLFLVFFAIEIAKTSQPRILNGEESEWLPFMVSVQHGKENCEENEEGGAIFGIFGEGYTAAAEKDHTHWCGGTIIGQDMILTAYHCVNHFNQGQYSVVIGTRTLSGAVNRFRYCVKKIIRFPDNHDESLEPLDIAIVQLSRKLDFKNSGAKIVELSKEHVEIGSVVQAYG